MQKVPWRHSYEKRWKQPVLGFVNLRSYGCQFHKGKTMWVSCEADVFVGSDRLAHLSGESLSLSMILVNNQDEDAWLLPPP
ncbi:hypothetical protein ACTXT7_008769 [Hymenolepis weldensis]